MAMLKFGSAFTVEAEIGTDKWSKSVCCGSKKGKSCGEGHCRVKIARNVFAKYTPEKYLLSHCTIIAAVDTELADPSNLKTDYYIHPSFSKYVNNNGDAWTKAMLANSYRSFVGSHNYLEHVQIPELSKGRVIDAILREVPVGRDKKSGKELTTYYVDILVATERKHKKLIADIQSGKLNSLSMGCKIAYSICTRCGNKAVDETQACRHVRFEKNNIFYDDNGIERKIAELCLPWNNKVLGEDGNYRYIEDIRVKDKIISHTGYVKEVTEIFKRPYSGELITIKAEGFCRTFESTPEHPFYIYDGEKFTFKKANELKLSDSLVSYFPIEEYPLRGMNKTRAMLLGLYAAEGSCYNGNIVEFTLNPTDEQDLAQDIISALESEFPPEVNRLREKKDWEKIIETEEINPVRRSDHGQELVDEDYFCLSCGAPSDYVVFYKTGRTRCKVCGSQLYKDSQYRFSKAYLYSHERKYTQNYIGDRLIKKDGSNKFFIRYRNQECFDFFRKYCPGKRAFLKNLHKDIIYAPKDIQRIILTNWLKGDGSIDSELRLRGYTTSEDLFRSMEILANRIGYWTRSQLIFNDKLSDLGELRKKNSDFEELVDDKRCHTRFVLYFSPRDSGDLCEDSGFIDQYPSKRKETRKKDGYLLHKIRTLSVVPYNGNVFNMAVKDDNSYIVDGIVTHNCGHASEPESVTFIDASWVGQPAFTGAVIRNIVNPPENILAKIEEANKKDTYLIQENDFLKAAHTSKTSAKEDEPPAEEPEPPAEEPEPPAEEPEPPAEDAPAEETPPAEEAPPAEEPPPEVPGMEEEQGPVKTWKNEVKKKVLQELGNELVEEMSGEDNTGPRELETLDDSLIRPTASQALRRLWILKESWDNFLKETTSGLSKEKYNRLKFGSFIVLNSDDPKVLADYGYNRRDFLAVMSYLDQCFKDPLPMNIKKAVAELDGTKGLSLDETVFSLQKLAGRKLAEKEIRKALVWLKFMDMYQV